MIMAEDNNIEQQQDASEQAPEPNQVETLNKKVIELEASLAQMKDQLLRKAAEFENYKRRVENDYANTVRFSNEELVTSLLPVLDDFHRSLKMKEKLGSPSGSRPQDSSADFFRGMELIYTKLLKTLQDEGIEQFDSVGKPFDPSYHDALLQIPKKDLPPHTVIEEVERGYTFHDKVIRHAKVVVSGEMPGDEETPTVPPSTGATGEEQ
jgi:molecular chaperone GrpE